MIVSKMEGALYSTTVHCYIIPISLLIFAKPTETWAPWEMKLFIHFISKEMERDRERKRLIEKERDR